MHEKRGSGTVGQGSQEGGGEIGTYLQVLLSCMCGMCALEGGLSGPCTQQGGHRACPGPTLAELRRAGLIASVG